jgi:hypothetical protein
VDITSFSCPRSGPASQFFEAMEKDVLAESKLGETASNQVRVVKL